MKILFVGSKNMGANALRALHDFQDQGYIQIVGVVARNDDDNPAWYKSVSKLARKLKLKLWMPTSLQDDDFLKDISNLKPDIGFCCFYPNLFKDSFFTIPKFGFYNLHFAPLPRYRGALPIPYAIINGEKEHGVTIHQIDKGMDSGPIVSQALLPIFAGDIGLDLYRRCEKIGLILFHETLVRFITAKGQLPMRHQIEDDVISHKRKDLKSLEIPPDWDMKRLYDFVRAFDFPPFDLPFMNTEKRTSYLAIRPEGHGYDSRNLDNLTYNNYKIFLIQK